MLMACSISLCIQKEALQEALGQALLTITEQDARGWFGHCGYQPVASGT
jgi:hypothetical protein